MGMAEKNHESGPRGSRSSISSTDSDSSSARSHAPGFTGSVKSRLRSRSNASASHLDRVHSAKYPDDNAVYHDAADSERSPAATQTQSPIQEVRGGVVNERDLDLEIGPELEKPKSTRSNKSQQDSTLVCPSPLQSMYVLTAQVTWDGPDDPENPFNWGVRYKWLLTITVCFM